MKTNSKIETCRQLISELRWSERQAETSARVASSKALWLGLEKSEFEQMVCATPSATYVRQHPHILHQSWEDVVRAAMPEPIVSDFDRLMNATN